MFQWLIMAAVFYGLALLVSQPQLQTGLWKAGHITSGAFIGYWIDRHLYGRLAYNDVGARVIARAVIIGAAIFGMALGL